MPTTEIYPALRTPANQKGEFSIQIWARVPREKNPVKFPVGEKVKDRYWLSTKKRVSSKHPDSQRLNKKIEFVLGSVIKAYDRAERTGPVTPGRLKLSYNRGVCNTVSFLDVFRQFIDVKQKASSKIREGKKDSTIENYKYTLDCMEAFEVSTGYELTFDRINFHFYYAFIDYIIKGLGNKQSTAKKYISNIKVFMGWGIDMEYHSNMMYMRFDTNAQYERKDTLSEDEILILESSEPPRVLRRYRDLFLFMFYTGMRYSDMCKFGRENVKEKDGILYMDYVQQKTGWHVQGARLPAKAKKILDKYDYFEALPIPTNPAMGNGLDRLMKYLSIDKHVTSHVARHTFVTLSMERKKTNAWIQEYTGLSDKNLKVYKHRSISFGLKVTAD